MIQCKRVYEDAAPDDGYRVLVDRLWPRGIKKEDLIYDEWCKTLAPPAALPGFDGQARGSGRRRGTEPVVRTSSS